MPNLHSYRTIPDLLDISAAKFPNKIALIFEGKSYTYNKLKLKSDCLSLLLKTKLNKIGIVGLLLSNGPEFIINYFGILKSGCIALLLPTNISDNNLAYQLNKTKPKLIISEDKYLPKLSRIKINKKIEYLDGKKSLKANTTCINEKNLSEHSPSTIIFTSGTTAKPKGIQLLHSNVVSATKNIIEYLKLNSNDVDLNISQLSHSFGLGHIHSIFAAGGTSILFRDSINIKAILNAVLKYKVSTFSATPTTLHLIIDNYSQLLSKVGKRLRLIQTNTSSLEPTLIKNILKTLPKTNFCYYYGLTEASRSTFITFNNHLNKIDSVGKPSPNVKIKIVDEKGKILKANQVGEICIKGKTVITKYWKNPAESKRIKQGWLYTRDLGRLDNDGYLFFSGRKDDLINIAGEKVYPQEVENIIKEIAGVKEVAIVGKPDKLFGNVLKAYLVVSDLNFNIDDVREICLKKLERFKIPRYIELVDEIPKTDNGKIRRQSL